MQRKVWWEDQEAGLRAGDLVPRRNWSGRQSSRNGGKGIRDVLLPGKVNDSSYMLLVAIVIVVLFF